MAGAKAERRTKVEREFQSHAREVAAKVAEQFQPVYERVCRERDLARERAAVLQTAVEHIALGLELAGVTEPAAIARMVLEQLGIVPDIEVAPADDAAQKAEEAEGAGETQTES